MDALLLFNCLRCVSLPHSAMACHIVYKCSLFTCFCFSITTGISYDVIHVAECVCVILCIQCILKAFYGDSVYKLKKNCLH